MRFVATFQNASEIDDGAGGNPTGPYSDVLTTRCQLIKDNGNEILTSGQIVYNQDFIMRCGYRPNALLPITTDTIVLIYGPGFVQQTFKIKTFNQVDLISHLFEFKLSSNG